MYFSGHTIQYELENRWTATLFKLEYKYQSQYDSIWPDANSVWLYPMRDTTSIKLESLLSSLIEDGAVTVTISDDWSTSGIVTISAFGTPLQDFEELTARYGEIESVVFEGEEKQSVIEFDEYAPSTYGKTFLYSKNGWNFVEEAAPITRDEGMERFRSHVVG